MKWVLIFWLFHGHYDSFGAPTTKVEFSSEAACKQAFQDIKNVNDGELRLRGVCIQTN